MRLIQNFARRGSFLGFTAMLLALWGATSLLLLPGNAHAAMVTSRSLTLSSSANGSLATGAAGSGTNGQQAKHTVKFTMATSGATMGSIAIIYCTSPIPQTSCTSGAATTGNEANLTSATVSGTGVGGSGWALDTTTTDPTITNYGTCNGGGTVRSNCVLLKPTSPAANTGTPTVTIAYGGAAGNYVSNPTADNTTFYVRIVVFSDNYTTVVDNGGVAASTGATINVTAKVQETLNFSVGAGAPTAPSTTCAALTNSALALGDTNGVLSFTTAYDAHSYFRVSTNANNGTLIYYSGDTLKSGANSIASIGLAASGTSSTPGTAQFGLAIDTSDTQAGSGYSFTNLAANNGSNVAGHAYTYASGAGTITNGGTAKFQYDVNSLTTPDPIAVATTPIICDTGSVRYLGNISTTTPPGIYTTAITYIAVPTY
ncbi:MAG TPA: hypothetical protein VIR03_03130 [Candidatus Saccharimonadales bacterium]